MKRNGVLIAALCLGIVWAVEMSPLYAQKSPKTLTLLYSNNLSGETDACPS